MKLIKAIVRPNKVDDVRDALGRISLPGMTVTAVRGHGEQKGHTAVYRGREEAVDRGAPPRQAERAYGDLPRQGVRRQPAAKDGDRGGRRRQPRRRGGGG